jgi:16S rRNA (cytosine1402-N4)-methyltransferase
MGPAGGNDRPSDEQGAMNREGNVDRAQHVPVLAGRVTALLAPALAAEGAVLVDATLGRAGHARALLESCPGLYLVGIDADVAAIEAARELLARYAERVTLVHARYDEIPAILGPTQVMGLLFDLGVSSPQLDDPARGFAYAHDAPLDMRMDRTAERTAADVVNGYPPAELARILHEYGEERFARRIAEAVARERARAPITSTQRLSAIVKDAIPAATRRTGGNPAKRTFQALRIEVNDELGTLRRALPAALDVLAVGGRVVVLAYHSLEDRIVKRELMRRSADQTPPGLPVPAAAPQFRLLTRGAERPGSEEVTGNPRAASARLRAAERIRQAA